MASVYRFCTDHGLARSSVHALLRRHGLPTGGELTPAAEALIRQQWPGKFSKSAPASQTQPLTPQVVDGSALVPTGRYADPMAGLSLYQTPGAQTFAPSNFDAEIASISLDLVQGLERDSQIKAANIQAAIQHRMQQGARLAVLLKQAETAGFQKVSQQIENEFFGSILGKPQDGEEGFSS